MKVRGRRRCVECGTRWSYFETGSPDCPDCGSLRSVAAGEERTLHTDAAGDLDLLAAVTGIDERPLRDVAEDAAAAAREYVNARGFVDAGRLRDLDGTFLAAAELRYAADHVRRALEVREDVEAYFLDLLAGAGEGDRPGGVPRSARHARGLAAVDAVEAYRRDLDAWLEEHPHPEVRGAMERLRDHERRIAALDGDVAPREADTLVQAARAVGEYLREGDESALARAEDRLSRLG